MLLTLFGSNDGMDEPPLLVDGDDEPLLLLDPPLMVLLDPPLLPPPLGFDGEGLKKKIVHFYNIQMINEKPNVIKKFLN